MTDASGMTPAEQLPVGLGRLGQALRLAAVPPPLRAALDALTPEDVADMLRGTTTMIRVLQQHKAIPSRGPA